MARLQILELPSGINDERPPFLLVIDQVTPEMAEAITSAERTSAELIGARTVLVFAETVHIPANEPAQADPSPPIVDFTDLAEAKQLIEQRDEARQWARHGYEIGQKHCGWTDHGVAPDWLTEGWPTHFDSCKYFKQASEYDTALSRVLQVADDLENEEAHGGVWDANQQAARLIRAAVGRARDEKAAES